MNEFYLGALDLSPYIVSVHHRNHLTYWAMMHKPPFYTELYSLLDFKRLPLFFSYRNRAWGFQVYLESLNEKHITFTIKNPFNQSLTNQSLMGLAETMPIMQFQVRKESRIMA